MTTVTPANYPPVAFDANLTTPRGYQLPHPLAPNQKTDVTRIGRAIEAIDADVTTVVAAAAAAQAAANGAASTTYVDNKIAAGGGAAPAALDTLKEIADKLATEDSAIAALTSTIAGKQAALGFTPVNQAVMLAEGSDLNAVVTSGFYRLPGTQINGPGAASAYGQMIVARGLDTVTQIIIAYDSSQMFFRGGNPPQAGGGGAWNAWRSNWHSGNFDPATKQSALGYTPVNKAGDTMTANLFFGSGVGAWFGMGVSPRVGFFSFGAETGGGAGSNLMLGHQSDVGAWLGGSVSIGRTSRLWDFQLTPMVLGNAVYHAGNPPPGSGSNRQQFDASGTWVKPSTGTMAIIQVWSGGASGARGNSGNWMSGGGGGYVEAKIKLADLPSAISITVGSGGAARTTNGLPNAGGASSFGSFITVAGADASGNGGGLPVAPFGGGLMDNSGVGVPPVSYGGGGGSGNSGPGGSSIFGGGGGGTGTTVGATAGGASTFGGAGGAGGMGAANGVAGSAPGGGGGSTNTGISGAGGAGRVVITVV